MLTKPFYVQNYYLSSLFFNRSEYVMGGAKKKSITKVVKAQVIQERKEGQSKKSRDKTAVDTKQRGIEIPDINDQKFISELSKLKVITPYEISSQFNLKISMARNLLKELERKNIIKSVEGNARVRIYQPVSS